MIDTKEVEYVAIDAKNELANGGGDRAMVFLTVRLPQILGELHDLQRYKAGAVVVLDRALDERRKALNLLEQVGDTIDRENRMAALKLLAEGCRSHPSYRAKRRPRAECVQCSRLWAARRYLDG